MIKQLGLNFPQTRSALYHPKIENLLWGRGTGKTFYLGYKSQLIAHQMPGSCSAFVGRTYKQLLENTLPGSVSAWQQLGYKEGVHFVVCRRPPDDWPRPVVPVLKYDHFISWYTGSGFHLVSQDRPGMARGLSVDAILGDEGLTLDKERFDNELIPANRGNRKLFGDHPLHHSITISSSKPTGPQGNWLHNLGDYYEHDGHDYDTLNRQIGGITLLMLDEENPEKRGALWREIMQLKALVKYYPKGGMFYSEANAFDNIANLGFEYLQTQRRTMLRESQFKVEVLNMSLDAVDTGFYAGLAEHHLYYNSVNYSQYLDLDPDARGLDCRSDADLDPDLPLLVGADWGASINFLAVAQQRDPTEEAARQICFINNIYVKFPDILDHAFKAFCDYYRFHPTKTIYLCYDHTGDNRQANSQLTYYEQAEAILERNGWQVIKMSSAKSYTPDYRYYLWRRLLSEADPDLPRIRFNGNNCKELLTSMKLTALRQQSTGHKKDKRSERKPNFPQEKSTHGGDAADTIICEICDLVTEPQFIDNLFL